ncbi:hypothetical protein B0H17DRAFT_1215454 [Mycena rosella]|uniref:Uncharacterized protein n=1 Tax=Mycena rosella TaxID=1033263 RepID=A0AAD7CHB8_MYCRO|nr:hypothetical protein B0H17DRAFT_1215454 [Mycena rosella]
MHRVHDKFRELVVAVLADWLLDLTRSRLGTETLVLRELLSPPGTKLLHDAEIANPVLPGIGTPSTSTIGGLFEHRPMLSLDTNVVFVHVRTKAAALYKPTYRTTLLLVRAALSSPLAVKLNQIVLGIRGVVHADAAARPASSTCHPALSTGKNATNPPSGRFSRTRHTLYLAF